MSNFLSTIQNHWLNISGKAVPGKIIVFESDDWGSVRIPSVEAHNKLIKLGIDLSKNSYNQFDSLETADDLQALYELIGSFRDKKGNHPTITTNFIVANPDFDKIKESQFDRYYFELFTETYKRNKPTEDSWSLIMEGTTHGIIRPQFHGREHLNVPEWLRLLKAKKTELLQAFDEGVYSIDLELNSMKRNNLMAAFDYHSEGDRLFAENQVKEGLCLFEKIFGYRSASFIAPCNVWDDHIERVLFDEGVTTIQSLRGQKIPTIDSYRTRMLKTGEASSSNQIYLVRNAYFEPSTNKSYDWVGNCLKKIRAAFFWKKPAIISMHRVNFMGTLSEKNRTGNLKAMKALLDEIVREWPDVEFMSSDQLGKLYR